MTAPAPMPVSVMNISETLAKVDAGLREFQLRIDQVISNSERWAGWLKPWGVSQPIRDQDSLPENSCRPPMRADLSLRSPRKRPTPVQRSHGRSTW